MPLAAGHHRQLRRAERRGGVTTTATPSGDPAPYNTYLRQGPPPGLDQQPRWHRIASAVQPAAGPWLFFVAVDPQTGETRFATDGEGHEPDVACSRLVLLPEGRRC